MEQSWFVLYQGSVLVMGVARLSVKGMGQNLSWGYGKGHLRPSKEGAKCLILPSGYAYGFGLVLLEAGFVAGMRGGRRVRELIPAMIYPPVQGGLIAISNPWSNTITKTENAGNCSPPSGHLSNGKATVEKNRRKENVLQCRGYVVIWAYAFHGPMISEIECMRYRGRPMAEQQNRARAKTSVQGCGPRRRQGRMKKAAK
ncbi:hypothetical protein WN55_06571 [Dufourea novaeangliae]|uniref:Uncharacterized protein n=1 Tax=Dufourea novaeangliae TaxID=178035 RepID=A0A154PQ95_DUFNO|nr:hypothetical protein WN55_06571 [Dufourea novaeangliae]